MIMQHESPIRDEERAVRALHAMLRERRVAVLTGAGMSTDSGIPDYRGPTTRHLVRTPIQHAEFIASEHTRRRYWARSYIGYPRMVRAAPNAAHVALASLELRGNLTGVITQNVDGLHSIAGSRALIELHGTLRRVFCLGCRAYEARDALQMRLRTANGELAVEGETRADGDVALDERAIEAFHVPRCLVCSGTLMPDVVFFGGNVPRERVDDAFAMLDASDVLLVIGSSLTVFSGYRFARHANASGKPVIIVTYGETRADGIATLRVDASIGRVLPALAHRLGLPA